MTHTLFFSTPVHQRTYRHPHEHAYQRGSTTLGIIVGVVLGLGVALGVSLYLANTGGPVQSKAINPAARIDPPKDPSKIPDPNESLYTRVPKPAEPPVPNPAASGVGSGAEPSATSTPSPAVAKTVPTPAPAPSKPELDGIGKIAAIVTPASSAGAAPAAALPVSPPAKPAPAASTTSTATPAASTANTTMPASAPAGAAGERYFVQAGAFSTVADAEAVKAKLALQGVSMSLSPRERDGQILQRVRTAPLAAVDAEKLRNTLKANGIETSLVKVQ